MSFDPKNIIDLSAETIMPIFNENTFVFFLDTALFLQNQNTLTFEIYLNQSLVCSYAMSIQRFLN